MCVVQGVDGGAMPKIIPLCDNTIAIWAMGIAYSKRN